MIAKRSEPSSTMIEALCEMASHGSLVRFQGGYWAHEKAPRHSGVPIPNWGGPTIEACVKRKLARYTEWKDGRHGRFPIRVAPVEDALS